MTKWGRTKYLEAKLGQDELGILPLRSQGFQLLGIAWRAKH